METHGDDTYTGDHFVMCTNIEPLGCMPEINAKSYVIYLSMENKGGNAAVNSLNTSQSWGGQPLQAPFPVCPAEGQLICSPNSHAPAPSHIHEQARMGDFVTPLAEAILL